MNKTYYDVFNIPLSASQEEIKIAYRKLAMIYHPDHNKDKESGEVKMKEINFIYSILSNPEKRKQYDSTITFNSDFDETENDFYSSPFIYCNEIFVVDSTGKKSKLKTGENIYCKVEIDKSIITWNYKHKEYFNLLIKHIFDTGKKEDFAKSIKFDFKKTPLCIAHIGESDIIIYKEDFELNWISESSYSKLDKRKGIITGIFVLIFLLFGALYFYTKFSVSTDKAEYLKKVTMENTKILEVNKKYYKDEYYATETEVSYILTDFYLLCSKETTKTTEAVDITNVPDKFGIVTGKIPQNENVLVLLYCPLNNGYKVKFNDVIGWVPSQSLENPKCKCESQIN